MKFIRVQVNVVTYEDPADLTNSDYESAYVTSKVTVGDNHNTSSRELAERLLCHLDDELKDIEETAQVSYAQAMDAIGELNRAIDRSSESRIPTIIKGADIDDRKLQAPVLGGRRRNRVGKGKRARQKRA